MNPISLNNLSSNFVNSFANAASDFSVSQAFIGVEQQAIPAVTIAQLTGSQRTEEFAPNGFGAYASQRAPNKLGTLSQHSEDAINSVFDVKYTDQSGNHVFNPTQDRSGSKLSHVYDYADYDKAFPNGTDSGTRGTDNDTGQSYAFASRRNSKSFGAESGISDPLDATACQEVAHNIIASHPELRGKLTTPQSEVVGEAVSLNRDSAYAATAFRNGLFGTDGLTGPGARPINKNYSEIASTTRQVLDGLAGKYGFTSGDEFMKDYVRYMAHNNNGQFSSKLITEQSLEAFVSDKFHANGADFTRDFQANMKSAFTQTAQETIRNALQRPDY